MSSAPPPPASTVTSAPAASTITTGAPSSVSSLGSEASAPPSPRPAASPRGGQLADVPEERSAKGGNGNGGDVEEGESRTTYRGSVQGADAPPPFDALPPPLSRIASSVHSIHLRDLPPGDLFTISRLRMTSRDLEEPAPPPPRTATVRALRWYRGWAVPGLGMFVEAWLVFAIGNIKPLLALNYPNCLGHQQPYSCSQSAADSATYVEVSGIIAGMLAMGAACDIIGRKWGSRLASSVMLAGGALLTACSGASDAGFLAMLLTSLFILGLGVGAEYPVAASSAAERAEGSRAMRRRRGETVLLTFSQQGWGNLANTLCIILLLAMQGATDGVTPKQAEITWRVQFAAGTAIALGLTAYRWLRLQESKVWKAERHDVAEQLAQKGVRAHHSAEEYKLTLAYFWPRVLVTSAAWGLSGFAFYGQKLLQARFIAVIVGPSAPLFTQMLYILLNNGVALAGYYAAAALIDRRWYGRVRMQAAGFAALLLLYLLCGALFDRLEANSAAFQALYYLASFFNQLGPNCTTFLVAGEVYPTGVRSFFHGLSAAVGKVGALAAALAFTNVSVRAAFYASAGAGGLGLLLTLAFLPDTTGLDLHELDRMSRYLLAGQYRHYHGEAVNPRYLSAYERWRRYDRHWLPEADFAHKQLQMHPHLAEAAESLASLSRQASSVRIGISRPSSVRLRIPSSLHLHIGPPSSVQLAQLAAQRSKRYAGAGAQPASPPPAQPQSPRSPPSQPQSPRSSSRRD